MEAVRYFNRRESAGAELFVEMYDLESFFLNIGLEPLKPGLKYIEEILEKKNPTMKYF